MAKDSTHFWESIPLSEMSIEQWESLCDGCAKCCLHKLEDEETGEVYYTSVACRYLGDNCRCTEYQRRNELVDNCISLRPEDVEEFHWLPPTCAYRLVAEGNPLPDWHPLMSGDPHTVHSGGMSVRDWSMKEDCIHPDDFEEHIIHWVE